MDGNTVKEVERYLKSRVPGRTPPLPPETRVLVSMMTVASEMLVPTSLVGPQVTQTIQWPLGKDHCLENKSGQAAFTGGAVGCE